MAMGQADGGRVPENVRTVVRLLRASRSTGPGAASRRGVGVATRGDAGGSSGRLESGCAGRAWRESFAARSKLGFLPSAAHAGTDTVPGGPDGIFDEYEDVRPRRVR